MRDIGFLLIVGGLLPYCLFHPWMGIMVWTWLSIMNPHRLLWYIGTWPIAAVVAVTTLMGLVLTRDKRNLPVTPVTVALALFVLWVCIASFFAFSPTPYDDMFKKVMKILFMIFVALVVIQEKKHVEWLTWILALSIGFYGIKGGIFTLMTGGSFRVWGPYGSFIEGNNEIALALVLVIPLFYFLYMHYSHKWLKRALVAAMILCAIASLGSHSRGALLAIAAMSMLLWWRSHQKAVLGPLIGIMGIISLAFMPEEWWARMQTISTYEEDSSAMGRINAWHAMFNIAKANFFGGGFDIYNAEVFARYAPIPENIHAAHSIYFQVMGEHGFVGFFIFIMVGALTWRSASWIRKNARGLEDMQWAVNLASMCQVSMFGFAVGGAFLSLAYFDLPYNILVLVVVTRKLVEARLKELKPVPRAHFGMPASPSVAT